MISAAIVLLFGVLEPGDMNDITGGRSRGRGEVGGNNFVGDISNLMTHVAWGSLARQEFLAKAYTTKRQPKQQ